MLPALRFVDNNFKKIERRNKNADPIQNFIQRNERDEKCRMARRRLKLLLKNFALRNENENYGLR